ncbi:DUF2993 domain-containing protein [Streptomyces sp. NPDC093970]|uniref:LmeA family phospholipid-binding protein n=1 Tax=Streptomyces sp. NPDC093970 TaxID=3155076 RepID=UPI003445FF19
MTARPGATPAPVARATSAKPAPSPVRRRLRRVRRPAAVALALLVLLAGTGEVVARGLVDGRLSGRLRTRIGDNRVRLGGSALLGLARGRFDRVTVTGDDARLGRLTGASVELRLTDVELRGTPRVGRLRGRVTVPADAVARSLQRNAPGLAVSAVSTDPAHGTLVLSVRAGLATVTVRPLLQDGRTAFELVAARVLGRPAPPAITAAIEKALHDQATRQPDPGPVRVTALEVTPTALVGTVRADDADLGRGPWNTHLHSGA